ncbi:sigma-54-dependent Fis family transcriptional regulator [bacterium]|nr:sigma-54-dependent Fis family transcriptional regulator [bacterium]
MFYSNKKLLVFDQNNTLEPLTHEAQAVKTCETPRDCLNSLKSEDYNLFYLSLPATGFPVMNLVKTALRKQPLLIIIVFTPDEKLVPDFFEFLVDKTFLYPYDTFDVNKEIDGIFEKKKLLESCNLVGKSRDLEAIADLILRVSPTVLPVLISGESGTGKELVARAVHEHSDREDNPFLAVNCGAIPEGVLESELFGHEKGSFTGAIKQRKGYFEQADKGTVFLDEIGDLPSGIQVKLLRVIEEKEFLRVGGTEKISVDVRIIAASNKDLKVQMENGNFREDLYFRLAGVKIYIPPLKDRPRDIPVLTYKFVKDFSQQFGKDFGGISESALRRMMEYHWPGNVRELKNLVENAILMAGKNVVNPEDIEPYFQEHLEVGRQYLAMRDHDKDLTRSELIEILAKMYEGIQKTMDLVRDLEKNKNHDGNEIYSRRRAALIDALDKNNWDKAKTADDLNISLRTLYRRLKKYGVQT